MPFSDAQGKDEILAWVKEIRSNEYFPVSILDVGPGCGTYSDLLRDEVTTMQFNAIEIWEPYAFKYDLYSKYDNVFIEDIRELNIDNTAHYEIVILGDVIEHMTKDEAKSVILGLSRLDNDNMIISFPVLHLDQGAYEGNSYETHVEHWTFDEMVEFCRENNLPVKASNHGDVLAWFWIQPRQQKLPRQRG